jgi:hypothetical protein
VRSNDTGERFKKIGEKLAKIFELFTKATFVHWFLGKNANFI